MILLDEHNFENILYKNYSLETKDTDQNHDFADADTHLKEDLTKIIFLKNISFKSSLYLLFLEI